ncbi:hypothetical protein TL16_g00560 [Triparma laevis f. inornata]|uniref:Uncharacterized protein n=1 Tax=Triparma laevis f. inornata TaxID=1714386 RepID=A0A9W6ZC98_9STRA|nr:hypothetical protein TL16_g00560 [Triparma laevis f. inornata]
MTVYPPKFHSKVCTSLLPQSFLMDLHSQHTLITQLMDARFSIEASNALSFSAALQTETEASLKQQSASKVSSLEKYCEAAIDEVKRVTTKEAAVEVNSYKVKLDALQAVHDSMKSEYEGKIKRLNEELEREKEIAKRKDIEHKQELFILKRTKS